jgi:hypothetical protein
MEHQLSSWQKNKTRYKAATEACFLLSKIHKTDKQTVSKEQLSFGATATPSCKWAYESGH